MTYQKIEIHPLDLKSRQEGLRKHLPNESEYNKILEHLRLLANGEITGRPIGERRQVKLIDMFSLFFKNIKKSSATLTKEDLSHFKEDLLNDKILKENSNPYSDETKEDCTETITRYLEIVYPEKVIKWASPTKPFRKWFVIRASKKTPEYLNEEEVKKLYDNCKTIEGKYIIAVLFDSGARIEEFLNIRFEDIEKPTANFPYYKIDFKTEYSKTEGRKIGLYWTYTNDAISKYLQIAEKKENKDQVMKNEYDAIRMFLSRLAKRVLNKQVTPHLLRKSSATFYAPKLNRQQICKRYGWTFSSEMPDLYISRAGIDEEKIKEVVFNDDLNIIKKENSELKTKYEVQQKNLDTYRDNVKNISKSFEKLIKVLDINPLKLKEVMDSLKEKEV